MVRERCEVDGGIGGDHESNWSEGRGRSHLDNHMGGTGRVWCTVARYDSVVVVIAAGVVIAEGPVKLSVRFGGGVDAAFLGRVFV
jgi:hypothetical protein